MDKSFINKKSEFLAKHLEYLAEYKESFLEELKDKPKDLKYVEKLTQEIVDCAVDINQYLLEKLISEKSWSSKQSFRDLEEKILTGKNFGFGQDALKLLIDTVSFRNEIVHSYDVNVYLLWSKRDIKSIIEIYKKYMETIMKLTNVLE